MDDLMKMGEEEERGIGRRKREKRRRRWKKEEDGRLDLIVPPHDLVTNSYMSCQRHAGSVNVF